MQIRIDYDQNEDKPITIRENEPEPIICGCEETTSCVEILGFGYSILIAGQGNAIILETISIVIILGPIDAAATVDFLIKVEHLAMITPYHDIGVGIE